MMDPALNSKLLNGLIIKKKYLVIRTIRNCCRHQADVEDYYQEVLLNFYRYMHTYNPARNLGSWLISIVQRFVRRLDHQRYDRLPVDFVDQCKLSALARLNLESITQQPGDPFYDEISPALTAAMKRVNPVHLEAFLLYARDERTYKEITEIQYTSGNLHNKNIDTVKSRIHLCRKTLRKYLSALNHDYKKDNKHKI